MLWVLSPARPSSSLPSVFSEKIQPQQTPYFKYWTNITLMWPIFSKLLLVLKELAGLLRLQVNCWRLDVTSRPLGLDVNQPGILFQLITSCGVSVFWNWAVCKPLTSIWFQTNVPAIVPTNEQTTSWTVVLTNEPNHWTDVVRRHLLPGTDGQSLVVYNELDTWIVTWPLAQRFQTLLGLDLPFITCEHLCNLPTAISPGRREASSWGRRRGRSRCGC